MNKPRFAAKDLFGSTISEDYIFTRIHEEAIKAADKSNQLIVITDSLTGETTKVYPAK